MNIEKDYERLYSHWCDEFEHVELTPLTKELISYYNNIFSQLKDAQKGQKNVLQDQLVDSYLDNFKFLINDFLKIREIKIINAALALREINLDHILEVEKLFYQKLVSSFKGFNKMRTFTMYDDVGLEEIEPVREIETIEKIKIDELLPAIEKEESKDKQADSVNSTEAVDYALIRFIKKAPPLVGVDFLNYGPFKKEDVAFIPLKNARILIHEKFAEIIQVS